MCYTTYVGLTTTIHHSEEETMSTTDILGRVWTAADEANRLYVGERLHYAGSGRVGKIDDGRVQYVARTLADGFGPGCTNQDALWDWSHVRDSSPQAFAAMAKFLSHVEAYG